MQNTNQLGYAKCDPCSTVTLAPNQNHFLTTLPTTENTTAVCSRN